MNRLELSYQGHHRLFSIKFAGRSKYCLEISKTWERLTCSHILYIYSFKIVERAYENRNRGDLLTASEYWEFFLVVRGTQTIHFPQRKFMAPDLLWSSQRLFRCARLTNPAVECSGAKPNSTNINPAKRTRRDIWNCFAFQGNEKD